MSILCDYIETQAKAKGKEPQEWLKNIVNNTAKCRCVTHVGKFTDPSVDYSISLYSKADQTLPVHGYLCTDSVGCEANVVKSGETSRDPFTYKLCGIDMMVSSASYLSTPKFLTLKLEDSRTVLEHLAGSSDYLDDLGKYAEDLEGTKRKLASVISKATPKETADNIRQVYFPVGDGYHLISLLTSSAVLFELKSRLREIEELARTANDSRNERYGEDHARITDLTAVGFGGAQPQNVSFVNTYQNPSLLFNCCPPTITAREITAPHRSFFEDTLRYREFRDEFAQLHEIFRQDLNNVKIRKQRKERTADIIDKVLTQVYALRAIEPGWTDRENCRLPQSQKIWLDEKNQDRRNRDDAWLEKVAEDFAHWFFHAYEFLFKKDHTVLGNEERQTVRREIKEVLRYDREVNI